jgi:hypothetical protein
LACRLLAGGQRGCRGHRLPPARLSRPLPRTARHQEPEHGAHRPQRGDGTTSGWRRRDNRPRGRRGGPDAVWQLLERVVAARGDVLGGQAFRREQAQLVGPERVRAPASEIVPHGTLPIPRRYGRRPV